MTMSNFEVKNSLGKIRRTFFYTSSRAKSRRVRDNKYSPCLFLRDIRRFRFKLGSRAVGRSFFHLDRSRLARESEEDFLAIARILIVETSV